MSKNRIQAKPPEGRLPAKTVNPVEHYHPIEHAVLAEYLDRKERLPAEAAEIDPHEVIPLDADWDESEKGIAPRPGRGGSDLALENAVARIVLAPIRSKLPRWGCWDGKEVFDTRTAEKNGGLPQRSFHSEPLLVLSINWADTGPGYSWPEDYYIAWVPLYDRYVVTVSVDDDHHGYLDFAIGWLKEGGDVDTNVRSIVEGWWSDLSPYVEAWQGCLDSGIVPDPYAWRNSVWHEEAEEAEEEPRKAGIWLYVEADEGKIYLRESVDGDEPPASTLREYLQKALGDVPNTAREWRKAHEALGVLPPPRYKRLRRELGVYWNSSCIDGDCLDQAYSRYVAGSYTKAYDYLKSLDLEALHNRLKRDFVGELKFIDEGDSKYVLLEGGEDAEIHLHVHLNELVGDVEVVGG